MACSDTRTAPEAAIACILTPGQYRARTTDLCGLAERALRSRERTELGERLIFEAGAEVEAELRVAVAAEASCCPFLTMDLQHSDDGHLVLDIAGPEDARPVIAELFAASPAGLRACPRSASEGAVSSSRG